MDNEPAPLRALKRAVKIIGGQVKTAEACGVSQPAVSHWLNVLKQAPTDHCKAIEKATGRAITRKQLRPDMFG